MKKFFLLLIFLGLVCSCSCNNDSQIKVTVYQVYESEINSNVWSDPRLDLEFKTSKNSVLNYDELSSKLRPSYTPIGDGYYFIVGFYYDMSLTSKIDDQIKLNNNLTMYYGCRG